MSDVEAHIIHVVVFSWCFHRTQPTVTRQTRSSAKWFQTVASAATYITSPIVSLWRTAPDERWFSSRKDGGETPRIVWRHCAWRHRCCCNLRHVSTISRIFTSVNMALYSLFLIDLRSKCWRIVFFFLCVWRQLFTTGMGETLPAFKWNVHQHKRRLLHHLGQ